MKVPKPSKKEVRENATITIKNSRAKQEVLAETGVPNDLPRKHEIPDTATTDRVGMSLGVTRNMGDFESLRADVWYSCSFNPAKQTQVEVLNEIRPVLEEVLVEICDEYCGGD